MKCNACDVFTTDTCNHHVKPARSGRRLQRLKHLPPHALTARLWGQIDRVLCRVGISRPAAKGGERAKSQDLTRLFSHTLELFQTGVDLRPTIHLPRHLAVELAEALLLESLAIAQRYGHFAGHAYNSKK